MSEQLAPPSLDHELGLPMAAALVRATVVSSAPEMSLALVPGLAPPMSAQTRLVVVSLETRLVVVLLEKRLVVVLLDHALDLLTA
jgi:hypothetical protein